MAIAENLNSLLKGYKLQYYYFCIYFFHRAIPKEDLFFDPEGKTVWYLFADIYCLDYDGNVFDAALIAVFSALKNGIPFPSSDYAFSPQSYFSAITRRRIHTRYRNNCAS